MKSLNERDGIVNGFADLKNEYPELTHDINIAIEQIANEYYELELSDDLKDLIDDVYFQASSLEKQKGSNDAPPL